MSATQVTVTSTQVAVRYRWNVGGLSIDMSADCWTTTLSRNIGRVSVEISADISVDFSVICRPTHLDRHIGRASTDTRPICRSMSICRPIYRSRGAQNSHDPTYFPTSGAHQLGSCQRVRTFTLQTVRYPYCTAEFEKTCSEGHRQIDSHRRKVRARTI